MSAQEFRAGYTFAITAATLEECTKLAIEEADRFFGDVKYLITSMEGVPTSYVYENGSRTIPIGTVTMNVSTEATALRSLDDAGPVPVFPSGRSMPTRPRQEP